MGSTDKKRRKRTLTGKQQAALLELLAGHTITEAAERTGIARQTISGWVNQDDIFAAELAYLSRVNITPLIGPIRRGLAVPGTLLRSPGTCRSVPDARLTFRHVLIISTTGRWSKASLAVTHRGHRTSHRS